MALKSVIEIDVDDSAFQRFATAFKDYQDQAVKSGSAWKTITDASGKQTGNLFQQVNLLQQVYGAEKKVTDLAEGQARSWSSLAQNAKTFTQQITESTRQLLRWTSLTGVISGLLGLGTLFGLRGLADSAFSQRRSSTGLGVTPGEQASFGLNFKKFVDPQAVLGGTNEALTDLTKRAPLYALGFNEQSLKGKDTAQVATEALEKVKKLVDETPTDRLQQLIDSRRLGQLGFDEQSLRRLKDTPADELQTAQRQYRIDQGPGGLGLDSATTRAWENLKLQLDRAGLSIENTLIKGLTGLAGPLANLSQTFSDAVKDFLTSKQAKEYIDDLGAGILWLSNTLKSEEFRAGVKTFLDDVIALAKAIGRALGYLANLLPTDTSTPEGQRSYDEEEQRRLKRQEEYDKAHPGWHLYNVPKYGDEKPDAGAAEKSDDSGTLPFGGLFKYLFPPAAAAERTDTQTPMPGFMPASYRPLLTGNDGTANIVRQGNPSDTRDIRNNNPAGLMFANQPEAIGSDGRFAVFRSMDDGVTANAKQLLRYQDNYHLNTLKDILSKWAPPPENDTNAEISIVSKRLGVDPNAPFDTHDPNALKALVAAMGKIDSGREIDPGAISRGVDRALMQQGGMMTASRMPMPPDQYGQQFKDRSVKVIIQNNTGGNVNVTASTLAV